jgi:hypothetical protein
MLKKIGIPVVAILAAFILTNPKPAQAGVHFGIGIYAAPPVYTYAVPAYSENYYADPYGYNSVDPGYVYYGGNYGGNYGRYYGGNYGYRNRIDLRGNYGNRYLGEHRGYAVRGGSGVRRR